MKAQATAAKKVGALGSFARKAAMLGLHAAGFAPVYYVAQINSSASASQGLRSETRHSPRERIGAAFPDRAARRENRLDPAPRKPESA